MAIKKNKELLEKTKKFNKENRVLHQQLREVKESTDSISTGNFDAFVIADDNVLKVYTEGTADKIYRILIEGMHEGAVTLTKDGTILYCNSYFANLIKLPLQKVMGTKFKIYINFSKKRFDVLLKQGEKKVIKEVVTLHASDGETTPVLMSVNVLSFDGNYILSIILTDLTIQNKNQEELRNNTKQLELKNLELENANKDLTSFTYVSSHDLQEPLRKIQNFANCILQEEEKNLSERGKEYFYKIQQSAKRMRTLIEDLLTYSQTKNDDRKFEKTDLTIIADQVKKDLEDRIQEKNATIEISRLCEVNVIRFQFRQLMHNLIGNSLKFSNPLTAPHIKIQSKITQGSLLNNIKLESDKDYCHLTYTDNGIGFDPQYSERIFEVFQRLHSQEEYKGTGIGLAICKRIIENHNGIISATGELNKGARFDIYIPVRRKS